MNQRYIVYTRSNCQFCDNAISLLNDEDLPYNIIPLGDEERVLSEVKKALKWKTFPIVFLQSGDGSLDLVGGYTDLKTKLEADNV